MLLDVRPLRPELIAQLLELFLFLALVELHHEVGGYVLLGERELLVEDQEVKEHDRGDRELDALVLHREDRHLEWADEMRDQQLLDDPQQTLDLLLGLDLQVALEERLEFLLEDIIRDRTVVLRVVLEVVPMEEVVGLIEGLRERLELRGEALEVGGVLQIGSPAGLVDVEDVQLLVEERGLEDDGTELSDLRQAELDHLLVWFLAVDLRLHDVEVIRSNRSLHTLL